MVSILSCSAEWSKGVSTEKMQVKMRHGLTGVLTVVGEQPVPRLFQLSVPGNAGRGGHEFTQQGVVFATDSRDTRDVLARDDEDMGLGLRGKIVEGDDRIRLVDELRIELTGCDAAKYAILFPFVHHTSSCSCATN